MYIHCVWSRHWPSPLTHQDAASDRARLVADKLAIGKEPKEARRGCAIAIAIMGRRQPQGVRASRATRARISSQQGAWAELVMCTLC